MITGIVLDNVIGIRVHRPYELWLYDNKNDKFETWDKQWYSFDTCEKFRVNMKFEQYTKCLPVYGSNTTP